ncbi:hypothetical protein [Clostridium sp.]|uniref:hypothetical protein n=1 Tax=Clostridium sp. TaxID=1506 RepID=UPI00262AC2CA|nr:hypothetical protein [Clostridium sp.]
MEKFKMSQFAKGGKKLIFKAGKSEFIEINNELVGEINFYKLDSEKMLEITKSITKKDGIDFLYDLIPYVCDIELDVNKETFGKWAQYPPRKEFVDFIDGVFSLVSDFNDITETVQKQNEITNKMNEKIKNIPIIENKKVKSKEELLDDLMKELFAVKDNIEKRDEILHKINKLKEEK